MSKKSVMIIDDHILFREGLASLLNNQIDFCVIGEAGTIRRAYQKLKEVDPDIVLLDIGLPDGDGLEALKVILQIRPNSKVVMLTVHEENELLFNAVRAGAKGYLIKDTPISHLLASLRAVERGEPALSREMMSRILNELSHLEVANNDHQVSWKALTSRELDVLVLLGKGSSNVQIAESLFISVNTVKVHIHNILEKLTLQNRHEAGQFARHQGLTKL
jgi:two-component system NarL family response regulator